MTSEFFLNVVVSLCEFMKICFFQILETDEIDKLIAEIEQEKEEEAEKKKKK